MTSFASKLIVLVFLLILSSCGSSVTFDPDFYRYSKASTSFLRESGDSIHIDSPRMGELYCMDKEKLLELKEILQEVEKESPWLAKNKQFKSLKRKVAQLTRSFPDSNQIN